MKTRTLALIVLTAFLAGAATPSLHAQAEQVKKRAKDLKKKVESDNTKTNAPSGKPGK